MNEKRKFQRKRITIDVECDISKSQKWLDSTASDISVGGMCLVTKHEVGVGTQLTIKFILPETEHTVTVQSKIVWVEKFLKKNQDVGYYNGIQFQNISRDDRDLIDKYVESTTFDDKIM